VAPLGTPAPIISKASEDLAKVVSDPDFKKRLANVGSYSRTMTPEQTLAFVDEEQQTWLPLLNKIR
jgi:tripartite-type tricarboxylate transporter receptor subunit TctC